MRADAGWGAAALVAVAAVVGLNSQQGAKSPADALGLPRALAPAAARTESSSAFERGPCGELETTIRNFLLGRESEIAAPSSCYKTGPEPTAPDPAPRAGEKAAKPATEQERDQAAAVRLRGRANTLQFAIAILPDPLHTHFSLSFDRMAEAIQQGAQDEDYFYDSSWLPWEIEEQPLPLLADRDKASDRKKAREEQPGILLFRKKQAAGGANPPSSQTLAPYEEGLAVFVVGEEPTTGIHKRQFENAAAWIDALQPPAPSAEGTQQLATHLSPHFPVKILGPTFSGSLPSLAQSLAEEGLSGEIRKLYANAPDHALSVYSGGVTGNSLVKWFTSPERGTGDVRFHSFHLDGNTLLGLYRDYLKRQRFQISHLAIISEDETAYGGYARKDDDDASLCRPLQGEGTIGPTCLYYPRDLSALREAYQKQGIFKYDAVQQSTESAQRQLASDLTDPEGKEHDTIRDYSGAQTALSQEAALKQIVSVLRAHQAEYLVLRSSNPLDELFLSYFLRQTYPEGRVVVDGSDLLLRRENGAAALSGIMTLTNYPLLPWEDHWTVAAGDPPYTHEHRVFAQEGAESTYIAARFLFHAPGCVLAKEQLFLPQACSDLKIAGYAPPFWAKPEDRGRPAAWLSVLGRDGFWPVAALTKLPNPPAQTANPCCDTKSVSPNRQFFAWMEDVFRRTGDLFASAGRFLAEVPSAIASFGRLIGWIFTPWIDSSAASACRPPWEPMPIAMKGCLLGILCLGGFHLMCCLRPSLTVKPVHRANFVRVAGGSHLALVVTGSVIFALVPTLLAWGYGAMSRDGEPVPHAWWYRIFLPLSWLLAGWAVAGNAWVESDYYPRQPAVASAPAGPRGWLRATFRAWKELIDRRADIVRAVGRPLGSYIGATFLLYLLVDIFLDQDLWEANRIPAYWRSINLLTGVSPLMPLLALAAGLYLWFWHGLQGLALFGEDRPVLPREESLGVPLASSAGATRAWLAGLPSRMRLNFRWSAKAPLLCMFSDERAARPIEKLCDPFAGESCWVTAAGFFVVGGIGLLLAGGEPPIRSLGPKSYSTFFCLGMDLCISLMLANAWQFTRIWVGLSQLLLFLDRVPLRRTMKALQDISWGSIWRMSGSVLDLRYRLLCRQLESLTHLANNLQREKAEGAAAWMEQIGKTQKARYEFAEWYSRNWDNWKDRDLHHLQAFQQSVAETAGMLLSGPLIDYWRQEEESLVLDLSAQIGGGEKGRAEPNPVLKLPPFIRDAEELVCLVYVGFIQNILGRLRTLGMQMLWLFVAATVSVAAYPFDPRPAISGALFALFLVLGAAVVIVYSQMHRDATLSLITNTNPGELGSEFWLKLLGFGAGPVLGLAATIFPNITGSLFSWLQPGLSALK